jgi:hypothetical protein
MGIRGPLYIVAAGTLALPFMTASPVAIQQSSKPHVEGLFATSSECMACHNNLRTPSGEDVSIGTDWRGTMMANSSRDPYWQASVRREIMDHPTAGEEIESECSICHMPMSSTQAKANGGKGEIFIHLPIGDGTSEEDLLAADGVSCTACHQITDQKLGSPESFTGGYVINTTPSSEGRPMFGRFQIGAGHSTVMRSATGFKPTEAKHIQESEVCATCHTLYTQALGPQGQVIGRLPEQVPYLEWRHSAFRAERSCQDCHMPAVVDDTPITNILGEPRKGFARHVFRGGNFLMLGMLNRYRADLGVTATSRELDASIRRVVEHLQTDTATVTIDRAAASGTRLDLDLTVRNVAGHKFPTAYPSRRAWLHVVVRDQAGRIVFESGAVTPNGSIVGNDNDADPQRFEPHHTEIRQSDQVQLYEAIMADSTGAPTTGLLQAVRFAKDNRLLPRGFNKATAEPDIAVIGGAVQDTDFTEGTDRVRYSVDVTRSGGPLRIDVELRFQPISFRWADNLRRYNANEPRRFVSYYDSMAGGSSEVVAKATATVQ